MKNRMALLLACLLCLCAVGAMAEDAVSLSVDNKRKYDIYPNGYYQELPDVEFSGFVEYTGPYVISGLSDGCDSVLDFHANAYDPDTGKAKAENGQNASYDVTFSDLCINAREDCTAIRFFVDEEGTGNCTITINLDNTVNDLLVNGVDGYAYPAFNNNSPGNNKTVEILVHNTSGELDLVGGGKMSDRYVISRGVKLTYDTEDCKVTIDGDTGYDSNYLEIKAISCQQAYNLTYVPTSATCTAGGKQEYYVCNGCGRIFLNGDGTDETTLDSLPTVGALGHLLTHVDAKEPTCTENGNIEYYQCTREGCGRLFSDAAGQNELTAADVILPAAHDLKKVEAKDPTYAQDGSIEHWACTRKGCGKLFADANGTQELTPAEVILPKLVRTDTLPQTGDGSRLTAWVALLGASCAGLWCLNRRRR